MFHHHGSDRRRAQVNLLTNGITHDFFDRTDVFAAQARAPECEYAAPPAVSRT